MRKQGAYFEACARQFLEAQGLRFLCANASFRCGELDLVMQENDTIVFVEVRQRKRRDFGSAVESVDWKKQQKWRAAASAWLETRGASLDNTACRFDLVAFEGDETPIWLPNFLDG